MSGSETARILKLKGDLKIISQHLKEYNQMKFSLVVRLLIIRFYFKIVCFSK